MPKKHPEKLTEVHEQRSKREVLAELLSKKLERRHKPNNQAIPLSLKNLEEIPLSFAQQRLWFIDRLHGSSTEYNIPIALEIDGSFEVKAATEAFVKIIERHKILRTNYLPSNGGVKQVLRSIDHFQIVQHDLESCAPAEQQERVQTLIESERSLPFNLQEDLMLRVSFIERRKAVNPEPNILLVSIHHIACDGWSLTVLINEFIALYQAKISGTKNPLKPLKIQYADYADWQRDWLSDELQGHQLSYWERQLKGAPATHSLPLDGARRSESVNITRSIRRQLSSEEGQKLSKVAQEHGLTTFMLLHAGLSLVLSKHSHSKDIVVGTPVANRMKEDLEPLIGFFVNTLVLRVSTDFADLNQYLSHVRDVNISAQSHQDVPFEQIVERCRVPRSMQHSPLFQISFSMNNNQKSSLEIPGVAFRILEEGNRVSKFDIEVSAQVWSGGINLVWTYNSSLFTHHQIDLMSEHLDNLLKNLSEKPTNTLNDLEVISAEERVKLTNQQHLKASNHQRKTPLPQQFESVVQAYSSAIAVESGEDKMSFSELHTRTSAIAGYLHSIGVGKESLVGLCLDRGIDLVIGILAIWRAGGAFVPLDPELPDSRLNLLLDDANITAVVSQKAFQNKFQSTNQYQMILLDCDEQQEAMAGLSLTSDLAPICDLSSLAYVMYTSGSTGVPKGVMIEHGSISSLAITMNEWSLCSDDKAWGWVASFAFDASLQGIAQLALGRRLVILPESIKYNPQMLPEWIQTHQIGVLDCTPSLLQLWFDSGIGYCLPNLVIGGESISHSLWDQSLDWQKEVGRAAYNVYGPTECCVNSTFCRIQRRRPTIGKPLPYATTYLLDETQQLSPMSSIAELYIGGEGLARGYLNREDLNAHHFIANPFSDNPDSRLYRTGDLVRYLSDGDLEFLGRVDDQVKIRGFRIELGEVEHQLSSCEGVGSSVVVVHEEDQKRKFLSAYIVLTELGEGSNESEQLQGIRQRLSRLLPEYMMPKVITVLEKFPLTPNGKIDKKALPAPDLSIHHSKYLAAQNESQKVLVKIWADLLKLDAQSLSINSNFFELGGDSILSIQVVSRAAQQGLHFSIKDLFESQSIEHLSMIARSGSQVIAPQGQVAGGFSLLPIQRRFFADDTEWRHFNQAALLITPADFSVEIFTEIIYTLVMHHDGLRLAFTHDEGTWRAQHRAMGRDDVEQLIEIKDWHDDGFTGLEEYASQVQQSLEPDQGRSLRAAYIKPQNEDQAGRLLLVIHHLVIDGVSWRILLEDFERLYKQYLNGKELSLPAKTSSYQQWGEYLLEYAHSDAVKQERNYWHEAVSKPVTRIEAFVDNQLDQEPKEPTKGQGNAQFVLSKPVTAQLLSDANTSYRTQINELLLAGLLLGLSRWSGVRSLKLDLEGHGRETLTPNLDLSRTVGWFTSVYPLLLNLPEEESLGAIITAVKEQYRSVPLHGIGFGVLSQITDIAALHQQASSELAFNYLGQFDQVVNSETYLKAASESTGRSMSAVRELDNPLVINGMVREGCLVFDLSFQRDGYQAQAMNSLMASYKTALEELVTHCVQTTWGQYSPADFPLAQVEQQELEDWQVTHNRMVKDVYPATGMQQGLLFHSLLDSASYVTQTVFGFEGLHIDHFQTAWQQVVDRHNIFRTAFVGLSSGNAHQIVYQTVEMPWQFVDYSQLDEEQQQQRLTELRKEGKRRGFEPEKAPLMRMTLVELGDDAHQLIWSHHHALLDGWSLPLVFAEVTECYRALNAQETANLETPMSYRSYMTWIANQDKKMGRDYWRSKLIEFDNPTPLPLASRVFDATTIETGTIKEVMVHQTRVVLDVNETKQIVTIAQQTKTTVNVVLQAVWSLILSRYSNESQVVFGSTSSGRPADLPGVEYVVGLFINTIPIVINVDNVQSVGDWLTLIHRQQIERDSFSHVPLVEIQRLSKSSVSLFDSLLAFENYPVDEEIGESVSKSTMRVTSIDTHEGTNYSLNLVAHLKDVLSIKLEADAGVLNEGDLARLGSNFKQILLQLTTTPIDHQFKVSDLDVVSLAESNYLTDLLNTTERTYPREKLIHQLFEEQAEKNPRDIAVVFEHQNLSYSDLNESANRLAHYLRDLGVGHESLVGIYLERGISVIVGIVAILKAGGAYVPLDPANPSERLKFMVEDSELKLIVSQKGLAHSANLTLDKHVDLIELDSDGLKSELNKYSKANPSTLSEQSSSSLAYVIYTSGSTGRPKGVMLEHLGLVNLSTSLSDQFELSSSTGVLQISSFGFDAATWDWSMALVSGATLHITSDAVRLSAELLEAYVEKFEIDYCFIPPALLETLDRQGFTKVKVISTGGEAVSNSTARHWAQQRAFYNAYGPTESTVVATLYKVDAGDELISIGRPISNTQCFVLDTGQRLLPFGASGELYIGGEGLARGYLNREDLNAHHFIANPFSDNPDSRLYRTGDLVRYLSDGDLEFLGRVDDQVKIRGFRIELGEVEHQLSSCEGVGSSVVVVHEEDQKRKFLSAYIVLTALGEGSNESEKLQRIRQRLSRLLPEYMMPKVITVLEKFPLTPNGKIDKKALPAPDLSIHHGKYLAAQNESQKVLVKIWADLLKLDAQSLSINSNFFELGGDSILSIQVVSRAAQQGLHFSIKDLFESQSIEHLSMIARSGSQVIAPQGQVAGGFSLLPIQRRFFADDTEWRHFNQAALLITPADFSVEIFTEIIYTLVMHHDGLRLAFTHDEGTWRAQHRAMGRDDVEQLIEIKDWHDDGFTGLEEYASQVQQSLEPDQGRSLRAAYIKPQNEDQAGRLLLVIHHLVIDGVSWRILLEDFERLYKQYLDGKELSLPAKTSSYQQWGEYLLEYAHSDAVKQERNYWHEAVSKPVTRIEAFVENQLDQESKEPKEPTKGQGNAQFVLSKPVTAQLLSDANTSYRTQINELLLAGLLLGLSRWSGVRSLKLDLEGHGRETLTPNLDLSRTVGWFTSVYPLLLNLPEEESLGAIITAVKEQYRSVPLHGIGFGVLSQITDIAELHQQASSELAFNYLGQFDQVVNSETYLKAASESTGRSMSAVRELDNPLVINGMVREGCLVFDLSFQRDCYQAQAMNSLMASYKTALEELVTHCVQTTWGQYSPADFPLAQVEQQELEDWQVTHNRMVKDVYPATGMQQGLLFHSLLDSASYVTQTVFGFEGLHIDHFQTAWQQVVDRHNIFRTAFVGLSSGNAHQIVYQTVEMPWQFVDYSQLDEEQQQQRLTELRKEDKRRGFEPEKAPLMRMTLVELGDDAHQLIWSHHHALLDGWSLPLVFAEVTECYRALNAQETANLETPMSYRNYITWLQDQDMELGYKFWSERLKNVEQVTPLPFTVGRGPNNGIETCEELIEFTVEETNFLNKFAQSVHVTVNVLVQAAWAVLLSRFSSQQTIVFGAVSSARPTNIDTVERIVGLFINTLPVVVTIDDELSVHDFLLGLHQETAERDEFSYVPFNQIQLQSPLKHDLFHSLLVFENFPFDDAVGEQAGQADLQVSSIRGFTGTNYDITLTAHIAQQLLIKATANLGVLSKKDVNQIANQLKYIVLSLATSTIGHVGDLKLEAKERPQVMPDLKTESPLIDLMGLFEQQALNFSENTALTFKGTDISYSQLNARTNQLADFLSKTYRLKKGDRVAIATGRNVNRVVSILAVLKLGATYVPLSHELPAKRIAKMLDQCHAKVLVHDQEWTQPQLLGELNNTQICDLDEPGNIDQITHCSVDNLRLPKATADQIAHIIFTSGSTGQPKGVEGTYGATLNRITWMLNDFPFEKGETFIHITSMAFIRGVWELLVPLCGGTRLFLCDRETVRATDLLWDTIATEKVTRIVTAPSLLAALNQVETEVSLPITHWFVSGEPLKTKIAHDVIEQYPSTRLFNLYGSTEVMSDVTWYEVQKQNVGDNTSVHIPIGIEIPGVSISICDSSGNHLPAGAIGEITVRGQALARGYLHDDSAASKSFIGQGAERVYRTGDLGYVDERNSIQCLGRIDKQVKIRGHRIELAEIEGVLLELPDVEAACVIATEDSTENLSLHAYVVAKNSSQKEWQEYLSDRLPGFMVPAHMIKLLSMPLKPNGKIDTRMLPSSDAHASKVSLLAPESDNEITMAGLWSALLAIDKNIIGQNDEFFELGGHSLMAIRLANDINQKFKLVLYKVTIKDVFSFPSLSSMAKRVDIMVAKQTRKEIELTFENQKDLEQGEI